METNSGRQVPGSSETTAIRVLEIYEEEGIRQLGVDRDRLVGWNALDDLPPGLAENWPGLPTYWLNPLLPSANCAGIGPGMLCCDEIARRALSPATGTQVQFLPIAVQGEKVPWWYIHIPYVIHDIAARHEGSRRYLTGAVDRLRPSMLFRLRHGSSGPYLTTSGSEHDVYSAYTDHHLSGLRFVPVEVEI
ncbi:MAG TPA: hypothetical protein PKE27_07535 [Povalibacter sp.]|uniref:hypothetical protein n=1 Tax=Povalibacter sp. TaxID=1962978 RepID=UPI002C550548|nr:hypothetical protein [Povalibacter sp.]HMN44406.1 hypothetical protein [Povalibacter sp.]